MRADANDGGKLQEMGVAAQLGNPEMKLGVRVDEVANLEGSGLDALDHARQPFQVRAGRPVGGPTGGETGGEAIHHFSDLIQLQRILPRQLDDLDRIVLGQDPDKVFAFENPKGFAQRCPADPKFLRELFLHQPGARTDGALKNEVAQLVGDECPRGESSVRLEPTASQCLA